MTSSKTAKAAVIIIVGDSKQLVHLVHFHQPNCEVISVMKNCKAARQLNILDNVTPLIYDESSKISEIDFGIHYAKKRGMAKNGDTIVLLKVDINRVEVFYIPYNH